MAFSPYVYQQDIYANLENVLNESITFRLDMKNKKKMYLLLSFLSNNILIREFCMSRKTYLVFITEVSKIMFFAVNGNRRLDVINCDAYLLILQRFIR